jgi:hypothetical protein
MFRPTDVRVLRADIHKARAFLQWEPKVKMIEDLVRIMVDADMRNVGIPTIGDGDKIIRFWFGNGRWWKRD